MNGNRPVRVIDCPPGVVHFLFEVSTVVLVASGCFWPTSACDAQVAESGRRDIFWVHNPRQNIDKIRAVDSWKTPINGTPSRLQTTVLKDFLLGLQIRPRRFSDPGHKNGAAEEIDNGRIAGN